MKINGKQSAELRSCSIKFKNCFKQIAVAFKIYADFESVLKGVQSNDNDNNASYTKNIRNVFLAVLLTKLYILMITLASQLIFTEEKIQSINLLKQFLKKMNITKRWWKSILIKILWCL